MKVPDLAKFDAAGVLEWKGGEEPLRQAATNAHLKYALVDLGKAKDRASLFAELDRALKLPAHFGHNFDALADVLEDRDWLGKAGIVIVFTHAQAYKTEHPHEWNTLEELLSEGCEFWKERHLPFWVFVG
jgi:RNAse (barnase) inhibitor barstar